MGAKGSGRFYPHEIIATLNRDELRVLISIACLLRASRKAPNKVVAEAARQIIMSLRWAKEFYYSNVDRQGYEIIKEINERGTERINRSSAKASRRTRS